MPIPSEITFSLSFSQLQDGRFTLDNQITDASECLLALQKAQEVIQAQINRSRLPSTVVHALGDDDVNRQETYHNYQPTDDTQPSALACLKSSASSLLSKLQTEPRESTAIQIHTPDDDESGQTPFQFGHAAEEEALHKTSFSPGANNGHDLLNDLLEITGIKSTNVPFVEEEVRAEGEVKADPYPRSDSFELNENSFPEVLLKTSNDPYLLSIQPEKTETEDVKSSAVQLLVNSDTKPIWTKDYETDDMDIDEMGEYRDPPSISTSHCSDSTYMSSILSPSGGPFDTFDEQQIKQEESVKSKSSRRNICGGKAVRVGAKNQRPTPYPTIPCRYNFKSKMDLSDYAESNRNKHWWDMLHDVEELYSLKINPVPRKVEKLRKDVHNLFGVVLFTPADWGDNQKRKGIYREDMKSQYNWDKYVAFRSVNNTPKEGDAPRAKKHDLVAMYNYLLNRYEKEIRPLIQIQEDGKQVPLPGVNRDNTEITSPRQNPLVIYSQETSNVANSNSTVQSIVNSYSTAQRAVNSNSTVQHNVNNNSTVQRAVNSTVQRAVNSTVQRAVNSTVQRAVNNNSTVQRAVNNNSTVQRSVEQMEMESNSDAANTDVVKTTAGTNSILDTGILPMMRGTNAASSSTVDMDELRDVLGINFLTSTNINFEGLNISPRNTVQRNNLSDNNAEKIKANSVMMVVQASTNEEHRSEPKDTSIPKYGDIKKVVSYDQHLPGAVLQLAEKSATNATTTGHGPSEKNFDCGLVAACMARQTPKAFDKVMAIIGEAQEDKDF